MKITIESTDRIVDINNVPARVWEGTTDTGIAVVLLHHADRGAGGGRPDSLRTRADRAKAADRRRGDGVPVADGSMKVFRCPGCGAVKQKPRVQRTCSNRCAHRVQKARDPQRYYALKRKAGLAGGALARERSIAFWAAKCPGVPLPAARRLVTAGYHAGYRAGQQRGFTQGHEAARSGGRTT